MELNEQNVVVEMAKDAVSDDFGKGFGIGVLATVGTGLVVKLVSKLVIKPLVNKAKAKKKNKDADVGEAIDNMNKMFEDDEEQLED